MLCRRSSPSGRLHRYPSIRSARPPPLGSSRALASQTLFFCPRHGATRPRLACLVCTAGLPVAWQFALLPACSLACILCLRTRPLARPPSDPEEARIPIRQVTRARRHGSPHPTPPGGCLTPCWLRPSGSWQNLPWLHTVALPGHTNHPTEAPFVVDHHRGASLCATIVIESPDH